MKTTEIVYGEFGIESFGREIRKRLGDGFWRSLTECMTLPDIKTERECKCRNMRAFMRRFEDMARFEDVKHILYTVRHGLTPSMASGARHEFLETGDLDAFLEKCRANEMEGFIARNRENRDFYGQPITDAVLDFIKDHQTMLAPLREGDKLVCMAYPNNMSEYIKAPDARMKRYHACHCPFAKESILSDQPVSATLCNCSLGHVMNFAEAFLDRPLTGRVKSSVLNGDLTCTYEIDIPPDVIRDYVRP